MHWLPALDTTLFRFFNDTLENPVFDVLMPWLSGNILFVPLLLIGAGFLIWRHQHKGILCVAMIALLVPLGDSFVSSTIKRAVGRPRPFVTLTEVHNPPGIGRAGNYSSMPSSHVFNWFAGAMIGWSYFRRSARVTVPLAMAVGLSRIYNGVHCPGDVIAGAMIGAGYGAAAVYALEALWRWAGKKFFPLWHQQLPSLVQPGSGSWTRL